MSFAVHDGKTDFNPSLIFRFYNAFTAEFSKREDDYDYLGFNHSQFVLYWISVWRRNHHRRCFSFQNVVFTVGLAKKSDYWRTVVEWTSSNVLDQPTCGRHVPPEFCFNTPTWFKITLWKCVHHISTFAWKVKSFPPHSLPLMTSLMSTEKMDIKQSVSAFWFFRQMQKH